MSQDQPTPKDSPVAAPAPAAPRSPGRPPRRGSSVALALLLALVALGATGYVGWRQWRQDAGRADDSRSLTSLQSRVAGLEDNLNAVGNERTALRQRLNDADQVNRSLREEVLGQSERLRNLEDAVAQLAEKSLSGHDALLLDETESLLRMAKERYALFHDAPGAASAYAMADQALAAVNDGAFSGLRQSVQAEREALEKSQPARQAAQLDVLQQLRETLPALPLKPLDRTTAVASGAWARLRQALGSVVSVQRDNGAPLAVADARLARQLTALDLAQAQSALLAYDPADANAALQRAEASLAVQFDDTDRGVQQARTQLAALRAELRPTAPVQLGAALDELRNLRAVHALKPAAAASAAAPAHAASGARP
ncbi:uroporphyrinogen-III C-methyltransferase [Frateuria defendens]|uniref:uroporphyrinogen-III C-methyltransferase n=1 Tax=Frateuria defendens TaxID=2219559 RepID=UPI00066FD426|nr:uroporphyrinogen-III C-methyltransferase [Frateuria defendens]